MIDQDAISALSALAQEHRLNVFRLLMAQGPQGLPAGEIAKAVGVSPSALSFHLSHLEHAGLVRSWRDQRRIFYAVELDTTRQLVNFLTQDCCQGHPEICGDLANLENLCAE